MKPTRYILLGIMTALGSLEASALAAEIQLSKGNTGKVYIFISGKIEKEDAKIFEEIVV